MGSLWSVYLNYEKWVKTYDTKKLKDGGEPVTNFRIGTLNNDDCSGDYDIEMYIRNAVYEKLCSGEYHIDKMSNAMRILIIRDANGLLIPPVKAHFCY